MIKLHDVIRNKVSHIIRTEKAIFFKENGWDFLMPPVSNLDCKPASLYNIVSNLLQMKQFCQQHKIKLYILEVPKREIIYREILKKRYGFDEKEFIRVSRVQETIREKVRNHHIPYVYPYNELRDAAKHDFVFFKSSHHWTDWGAFVGYRELMKEIGKDFSDMPAASLNDYQKSQNWLQRDDYMRNYRPQWHFSQFFNDGLLDDHLGRTLYTYYDHKNADKMSVHVGKFTKEFTYPCGKHKIMLIGTSQNENFLQFIPYSAAQTKYIRLNLATQIKETERFKVLKLYRKDILAFKPEILILSISTDNLSRLRDLCSIK